MISLTWYCSMTLLFITQSFSEDFIVRKHMRNKRLVKNAIVLTHSTKQSVLLQHNDARSDVIPTSSSMLNLVWDDELGETAQSYSRNCVYEHSHGISTSKFNKIGENLYISSREMAPEDSLKEAIQSWNEEQQDYNFTSSFCSNVCGHYTQLVWNSTYAVGCGLTTCTNIKVGDDQWPIAQLVVCQYGPAGNFNNKRPYKTGTPCSDCPSNYSCINNLCNHAAKNGFCLSCVVALILMLSFIFTLN